MIKTYKVVISQSGKQDIEAMKKYILENFKYHGLAEKFSRKMKERCERWKSSRKPIY